MSLLKRWKDSRQPQEYFKQTLEWYRNTYECIWKENPESMTHTVLAKVFLQWEKKHPQPNFAGVSKDLDWACDVTQFFACLPPQEAVDAMAVFVALDKRPELSRESPEFMERYERLMGILAEGVENNTLVEMYKRHNLEPVNDEKAYYDRALAKLYIKTVVLTEDSNRKEQ